MNLTYLLFLLVALFSILSVTVPNYYMKGKGCYGIFDFEMEGSACLGECSKNDPKCKGTVFCKVNKALPLVVAILAIISVILLYSKKGLFGNSRSSLTTPKELTNVLFLTTFVMLMTSIAAIILQTQSPMMGNSEDPSAVSIKIQSNDAGYSMGFSFSVMTIIFGTIALYNVIS